MNTENTLSPNDHDMLVELRAEMRAIRADIKELKDTTSTKVIDHETRIRSLEESVATVLATKQASDNTTRIGLTIFSIMVGIITFIIGKLWQ